MLLSLGRHLLTQQSLVYEHVFRPSARVSLVFSIASITLLGFLVIHRPSSTIPDTVSCLPSLHDATASPGRRVMPLWLLVTRWRHCFLPPVHGALFFPRFHIVEQSPGLAPEAPDYLQEPRPVYREDAACGTVLPGLVLCFFTAMADTRTLLLPTFPFHSFSRLRYYPRFRPRPRLAFVLSSLPPFPFPPQTRQRRHTLSTVLSITKWVCIQ